MLRDYLEAGWIQKPNDDIPLCRERIEVKEDGLRISDKLIEICEDEELTPDILLKAHNLSPDKWTITNYINNRWHSQVKNGKRMVMYQSKIVAKPVVEEFTFDLVDKYFEDKNWYTPIKTKMCTNYEKNNEFLEIDLADAHIGLLAWKKETGEDYDIKIAVDIVNKCIDDIIARIGNRKFEKIYYCCLGDFLHTDSFNNTTNKGTQLDVDSRYAKMFDAAIDLQISIIDRLSELSHVIVPYVAGNHDKTSGYSLIKGVEKAFRKCENVSFDTRPIPRKIIKNGDVLIGISHGCMTKKNKYNWLISEYKKEFGEAKYIESHFGHTHELKTIEYEDSGIVHRALPSTCGHSSWEHWEGYPRGIKAVVSFVWDKKRGLRDIWYSNPDEL